jgi:two-component system, cell cycle sensor histidine kinase and response regulator CckA
LGYDQLVRLVTREGSTRLLGQTPSPRGRFRASIGLLPGAVVVLIGGLGLLGWLLDSAALKNPTSSASMKANTAIELLLAGSSLLLFVLGVRRTVPRLLGASVAVIGLLTLAEYAFGVDLGIDELLFRDSANPIDTTSPGRMGTNTAVSFVVAGLSLLLLDVRWRSFRPAQLGALLVALVAFAAALGYVFGVSSFERSFITKNVAPMAVHTAVAFLVLAIGILVARPGVGVLRLATSGGAGGVLARRLLPAALLAPVVIGYALLEGQRGGLYGREEGVVFFTVGLVVAFGVLVLATARSVERADVERHETEARKSAILDSALDCVITVDQEGRIVEFNPAAERTFGYELDDVAGKRMAELVVPPSLRTTHYEAFDRCVRTGEGPLLGQRLELTGMRADGSEFPVELSIVRTELSGRQFFTGYVRDLSDRKQAEEERESLEAQLRQAQKMEAVGRLAGGIAHDFNNLLTVISGYTHLLLNTLDERTTARAGVEEIKLAADRASALTGQLLAFSRRQVLEPQLLDLNTAVATIVPMLQRVLGEDIDLVTDPDPGIGRVLGDPNQLDQVILNLAVNARDAMPDGGTLLLETRRVELDADYVQRHASVPPEPGRYVMLAVTDTGVGMDEETRSRAFEPFFTMKEAGKGTGLGLSTVYGIVRQSGGAVFAYSEPARGTTVKIYLPLAETGLEEGPSALPPADGADELRGTETVLIVEDDAAVRSLVRHVFLSNGYTVLDAPGPAEALEIFEQNREDISLVVTDLVMPGGSGLDLSEKLLTSRPGTKVICMTGYSEQLAGDWSRLGSGAAFIQKPFTVAGIARKARELLDKA